jgi:hypothetical protein
MRLFISQLNDFLVLPFQFGNVFAGSVNVFFFFFHADSLTRRQRGEKKRRDPCFFQDGGRKGDETHIIQNALQPVTTRQQQPRPAPKLVVCLSPPDRLFRLPTSHLKRKRKKTTTKLLTNDDLRTRP